MRFLALRMSGQALAAIALVLVAGFPAEVARAQSRTGTACEVRAEDVNFFRDNGLSVKLGSRLQFNKLLLRETIMAKVSGGVAILTGNVSSPDMVRAAGRIAAETGGIRCVQNHLKVGPPLEQGGSRPLN